MRASFGERTRAVRRSIAASLQRRAALSPGELPPVSASSWQGTVVSPGGAPAPPECHEVRSLTARRRRIADVGFTRYRPSKSDPANITHHDSALGGSDHGDYIPVIIVLSSAGQNHGILNGDNYFRAARAISV